MSLGITMMSKIRHFRGLFIISVLVFVFIWQHLHLNAETIVEKVSASDLYPLQTQCDSFESIPNDQFDILVKSGNPVCKKTKWGRFSVYLATLKSQSGDFPIVVYKDVSSPSNIVVHIHGGPRILTGLIEPMLMYGRPLASSFFVRPTYMGSLNRTKYPKPDLNDAVDEVKQTIKTVRLSKLPIVLSADSAGSFILKKSCDVFCHEQIIYIAPMTLSPIKTSILNKKNSLYCTINISSDICNSPETDSKYIQFFPDMQGNSPKSIVDLANGTFLVHLDGNNQFMKFFGSEVFFREFYLFDLETQCADVIYDKLDPIIGVQNIEHYMKPNCPSYLHNVENFRHSLFINSASGISIYWDIVRNRNKISPSKSGK